MLAENEYYVEKILDKKVIDNVNYYLIKWYDYDSKDSTWEPEWGLKNLKGLIEKFEKKKKKENMKNMEKRRKKLVLNDEKFMFLNKPAQRSRMDMEIEILSANSEDIPESIIGINLGLNREKQYLVKWKRRSDGTLPEISLVSSDFLREKYPILLISYLETRISFN